MEENALSKEIIDSIKKAEANAKKDKAETAAEVRRLISEAVETAKNEHERAVANAERDMTDKLLLITNQSEALLVKNKSDAEADAAKEVETAMANMNDAVALIIGELAKNVGK